MTSSSRNKANKRKGAQYETDLVSHLRELGFECERLRLTGRQDEGDIAIARPKHTFICEAKNTAQHDLSGFVGQAELEARHYAQHRGKDLSSVVPVAMIKRRNNGIGKSYVVMTLDTLLRII